MFKVFNSKEKPTAPSGQWVLHKMRFKHRYYMQFREWISYNFAQKIVSILTGIEVFQEASWPQEWSDYAIKHPSFQKWLRSLGIEGQIGTPIEGGVGRAYPFGDYMVKFTTDRKEVDASTILKGRQYSNLADVLGTVNLGNVEGKTLYAIVQERLNTGVSKKHRIAGQAVYDYLDDHYGKIGDLEEVLPIVLSYLKPKYKNDPHIPDLVQQILSAAKEVQDATGVTTQDMHGANLAFKGRKPAFFDLGRSMIDFDHPATAGAKMDQLKIFN